MGDEAIEHQNPSAPSQGEMDSVGVTGGVAETESHGALNTVDKGQQQQLVDRVLRDYFEAIDAGDTAKQHGIEQQVLVNPSIAELFSQRIAEIRQAETEAVRRYAEATVSALGSLAKTFFNTIGQDQRNPYHILNKNNFQKYSSDLTTILKAFRNATTLSDLGRLQEQLNNWSESFNTSVSNGRRVAENVGGSRQLTEHLDVENKLASTLVVRIAESKDSYVVMCQQLRP